MSVSHLGWALDFGSFFSGLPEGYEQTSECAGMVPTGNGGVVLAGDAGYFPPGISGDRKSMALIMALSGKGSVDWIVGYNADPSVHDNHGFLGVTRARDGGYLGVGYAGTVDPTGPIHIMAMKLAQSGDVQWLRSYGLNSTDPSQWDRAIAAVQVQDGGYVIIADGSPLNWNTWLLKVDALGHSKWVKLVSIYGSSIQATSDGGFVMAGFGHGAQLVKFDAAGNIQWHQAFWDPRGYSLGEDSHLSLVSLTSDGGYVVAGDTVLCDCEHASRAYWVCKLDSKTHVVWRKGYQCLVLFQTPDGGYLLSGPDGVTKLGPSGGLMWHTVYTNFNIEEACPSNASGFFLAPLWYDEGNSVSAIGLMQVDPGGAIGPSCSIPTRTSITEGPTLVHAVSSTSVHATSVSFWERTLDYQPYSVPWSITMICAAPRPPVVLGGRAGSARAVVRTGDRERVLY